MTTMSQNLIDEINETIEELFWIQIDEDMNISIWQKKWWAAGPPINHFID